MVNARLRHGGHVLRVGLALALGIGISAATLVSARIEVTSLRYRLSALLERESELRRQVEKLRVEEAALAAPDQLEGRARSLGLRYPVTGQVVRLATLEPAARTSR